MRRLDHARVSELGDRVVQLERGPRPRGAGPPRCSRRSPPAFINVLSRKWSASSGCWPGIPLPGTDFSCPKDVSFGQDDDAL